MESGSRISGSCATASRSDKVPGNMSILCTRDSLKRAWAYLYMYPWDDANRNWIVLDTSARSSTWLLTQLRSPVVLQCYWCSSTDYFGWFRHSTYVGSCLDRSGGSGTDFGSWWDSWFASRFGTVSEFFIATFFWWWILIALWHSVTKKGST